MLYYRETGGYRVSRYGNADVIGVRSGVKRVGFVSKVGTKSGYGVLKGPVNADSEVEHRQWVSLSTSGRRGGDNGEGRVRRACV